MTSMNFFYIRNHDRHPVGIGLVGLSNLTVSASSLEPGVACEKRILVRLAVSLCAPGDTFDKETGIRLARERLYLNMVAKKGDDPVVARIALDRVGELTCDELWVFIYRAMQRTGIPHTTWEALDVGVDDHVNPFLGCLHYAKKDRGVVDA